MAHIRSQQLQRNSGQHLASSGHSLCSYVNLHPKLGVPLKGFSELYKLQESKNSSLWVLLIRIMYVSVSGGKGPFYEVPLWVFPKIRGTFLGGPITRIIVYCGLYWGPPILGN